MCPRMLSPCRASAACSDASHLAAAAAQSPLKGGVDHAKCQGVGASLSRDDVRLRSWRCGGLAPGLSPTCPPHLPTSTSSTTGEKTREERRIRRPRRPALPPCLHPRSLESHRASHEEACALTRADCSPPRPLVLRAMRLCGEQRDRGACSGVDWEDRGALWL